MNTILPLKKMSKMEKLAAMEELWADLSSPQEEMEMPAWHGDVLRERQKKVDEGSETFIPWEEAKTILTTKMQ